MQEIYTDQLGIVTDMKNLFKKISGLSDDLKGRHSAEAYIERLDNYYYTFQEHHKAIISIEDMSSEHDYLKKKSPTMGEDAHYLAKADFKRYIASLEWEKSLDGTLRSPKDIDLRVPKLRLPPVHLKKL